jgi:hypothetical protein
MKIREVIKLVEADGWYAIGQEGSLGNTSIPRKRGASLLRDTQERPPSEDVEERPATGWIGRRQVTS